MATRRGSSSGSVTGAITDLQRRVKFLQSKPVPTRLANEVVARSAIQPRAVSTDQIALNAVTNDQVAADAIEREQIAVSAVGTAEIDNLAVTTGKLNDEAVTTEKLGDDAVVTDKILNDAVVTAKLGPFAVTNAKLQDAAVELRNMTPNSVQNNTLTTDSVNFRTIAVNAVGNENMLGDAVGNDELQNDAVNQGNMQNDSVGFGELQSSSVGNSTLQNGAVTDAKIGGTVGGGKIGSGIRGGNINGGSIPRGALAAGAVTSNNIDNASFSVIVSRGLTAGAGILKRGNNISIQPAFVNYHTHNYFDATTGASSTRETSGPRVSSAALKKNISDYKTVDPKNLLNLQLKQFQYKRSNADYHRKSNREWMHGYMIEDILKLGFDEVIHYDKKGNPEKFDYSIFSVLVLELVKVQQDEIESLQEQVKELREK